MRFLFILGLSLLLQSAFAQANSHFFDYAGFNVYWNGTSWTSYSAGYGNVMGTVSGTGDFTLYTTGTAASAGLARTLTPVLNVSAAGAVSATAATFGNITATGTISTTALTVNGIAITSSGGSSGVSATMFTGFPDAIACGYTGETPNPPIVLHLIAFDTNTNDAFYAYMNNTSLNAHFSIPSGASNGTSNISTSGTYACNKSIAQLYASGQAFNFVGNGGANGTNGYDNIVSSTTKVTANQTGYISLTTAGTTTGYFDTAGRLIVPGVSTTGPISATSAVIAGTVKLFTYSSAPIACSATYKGLVAMNSTTDLCVCNGTLWVRMSSGGTACAW